MTQLKKLPSAIKDKRHRLKTMMKLVTIVATLLNVTVSELVESFFEVPELQEQIKKKFAPMKSVL